MRLILILLSVFPQLGVAELAPAPAEPAVCTVVVRTHRGALRHVGARATPYAVTTPAAPVSREIRSLRGLRLRR